MILVTGGTGDLGGAIVRKLVAAGQEVRLMTRGTARGEVPGVQWCTAQLASGVGLLDAVAGVDAIVHAAFSSRGDARTDVLGTQLLLASARDAGCGTSCRYRSLGS